MFTDLLTPKWSCYVHGAAHAEVVLLWWNFALTDARLRVPVAKAEEKKDLPIDAFSLSDPLRDEAEHARLRNF